MIMEINKIYNEDCLTTMANMPSGAVDLTVTSPPYDNLRTYAGYLFDFIRVAGELFRVTKNGGVVVWVVNDATIDGDETGSSFRQAVHFKEIGFKLHDTMIWHKLNPMPTQHIRYENSFEFMFVLSKGKPDTTNILREPTKSGGAIRTKHRASSGKKDSPNNDGLYITSETKIRHNVWEIPIGTTRGVPHAAPFPEKLARDHILSWSNEADLVYDPFIGSGTTAKMAILTKRNYIGSEISEEYYEFANKRIRMASVEAVTPDLFGTEGY